MHDIGYVYIYSSDGAQWSFESRLAPTSVNIFYKFGNAVSIYNDIIAVGSSGDDAPLSESGNIYHCLLLFYYSLYSQGRHTSIKIRGGDSGPFRAILLHQMQRQVYTLVEAYLYLVVFLR